MRLLKGLIFFIYFWSALAVSLLASSGRWLAGGLLRSKLALAAASLFLVAVVGIGVITGVSVRAAQAQFAQPLAFPHNVHAGELKIDCLFCHRTAAAEPVAGIPAIEQCLFCHRVAGRDKPEVRKLVTAAEQETPLNWVRVYRLPDTVQFDHSAHVRVNISCSTCHGAVEKMRAVAPVRSLNMGDCVSCHRANNAPTACSSHHY